MRRTCIAILLSLAIAAPAAAQRPHRAPPAPDRHKKKKKKRRAPPKPEPDMPVRKAPAIGSFRPTSGAPGTIVTIEGEHFDETTKVRFNGRWLKIVGRSDSQMEVRIPRRAVTDRFVVTKAGFRDVSADDAFNVVRRPKIRGFAPRTGGYEERVTITGRHFLPDDEFVIGKRKMEVVSHKHNRVVVVIPKGAIADRFGVRRGGRIVARARRPFEVVGLAPVLSGFSPDKGGKGTVVRITGKNIEPTDWVELGGRRLPILARGAGFLEVRIGNHPSGRFMLRGRRGRRALTADRFTVLRPPRVRGFAPKFGPPGTRITIRGDGFASGDQVYVGDAMLTIRTLFDRRIVAELPAGVSSGRVSVQRGTRRYHGRGRFEVILPPVIANVAPRKGPPGSRVTISARNLMPGVSVLLAGQSMRIVKKKLPDEVVAQVPGDGRSGAITVVTRGGSAKTPFPFRVTAFAEISSFFPLHGLVGSTVTIRGNNFHRGIEVWLGPKELPVTKITPRELKVEIPEGASTGRMRVVSHGRELKTRMPFTVDQPKPEVEFTFAPTSGRRGSEVTLFLDPPRQSVTVFFNGRPLPKRTMEGGRRLVITVPSDARTGYFELEYNGRQYRAKKKFRVR